MSNPLRGDFLLFGTKKSIPKFSEHQMQVYKVMTVKKCLDKVE